MSEYIMERFHRNVSEAPNAPLFYDDTHPNGITFRQFDEMSARVYGWLKKQGIGREDFVLIHLPRGLTPFAVAAGIDDECRLIVTYADGRSEVLGSGEISIRL